MNTLTFPLRLIHFKHMIYLYWVRVIFSPKSFRGNFILVSHFSLAPKNYQGKNLGESLNWTFSSIGISFFFYLSSLQVICCFRCCCFPLGSTCLFLLFPLSFVPFQYLTKGNLLIKVSFLLTKKNIGYVHCSSYRFCSIKIVGA